MTWTQQCTHVCVKSLPGTLLLQIVLRVAAGERLKKARERRLYQRENHILLLSTLSEEDYDDMVATHAKTATETRKNVTFSPLLFFSLCLFFGGGSCCRFYQRLFIDFLSLASLIYKREREREKFMRPKLHNDKSISTTLIETWFNTMSCTGFSDTADIHLPSLHFQSTPCPSGACFDSSVGHYNCLRAPLILPTQ